MKIDIETMIGMAKTVMPDLFTQSVEKQSKPLHALMELFSDWFKREKIDAILTDDQEELIMVTRVNRGVVTSALLAIDSETAQMMDQAEAYNLTEISKRVPLMDMIMALANAKDGGEKSKIKLSQTIENALEVATDHPDCRLVVEQPSATDDVLEEIHTKTPQEQPNVDALGATEKETGGRITDAERYGNTEIEWLVGKDAVERTTEEIQAPYREDDPNSPDFFIGGDRVLVFDDEEVLELTVPLLASKHEVLKMAFEHEEGAEFYAKPPFNPEKTVVWMVGQHTDNGTSDQILSRYKEDTDSGNCYVGGDRVLNFDEDQSFNLTVPLQATRHEVLKIAFETEPGVRFYAEPPFNPANHATPGVAQTNQEPTS
jgi:DNA repair protein RadC